MVVIKKNIVIMELEARYIVPYLPFELKIQGNTHGQIETLSGIKDQTVFIESSKSLYAWADICEIKLILQPISNLFIEDENEHSIFDELLKMQFPNHCDVYDEFLEHLNDIREDCNLVQAPYEIFEWFLANNYDVFNLVPNNLAVDVNTISTT